MKIQRYLNSFRKALAATLDNSLTADDLVALNSEIGKYGVDVMALLDKANTSTLGKSRNNRSKYRC